MPTSGEGLDTERALRHEIARLQALVGPDEQSYAALRSELNAAGAEVKAAHLELGRLRGMVTERDIAVRRAQQDLFHVQRLILHPGRALLGRLRRLRRR